MDETIKSLLKRVFCVGVGTSRPLALWERMK
jgi:hypothetical protein